MAITTPYQFPAQIDVFAFGKNSTSGLYEAQKADGSTATANSDKIYTVTEIEQSQLQPQDDGSLLIPVDQYDGGEDIVDDVLNPYTNSATGATGVIPADIVKLDGSKISAAQASGQLMLWIAYTYLNSANTKRLCWAAAGSLKKSSGQLVLKNGQWVKTALSFASQSFSSDYSIPVALYDSAMAVPAAAVTIPASIHYDRKFYPKGS